MGSSSEDLLCNDAMFAPGASKPRRLRLPVVDVRGFISDDSDETKHIDVILDREYDSAIDDD
jgi:hypothetical protein